MVTAPLSLVEQLNLTLAMVPAGKVVSYKQLADWLGKPKGARLIGRMLAQARSPYWYRVLRASGELAFPKDSASYLRQADLLRTEGVIISNGKVGKAHFWQPELD